MELLELLQGAVVFRAGDPGTHAYLIRKGSVELVRGEGDAAVSLARLEAGEVFGEMSLIEERPHSLSARAASHVLLSSLTRDEFEELLTSDPATFRIYLKVLFERLRELSAKVEAASSKAGPPASAVSVTIHPLTRRSAATLPHEGLQVG
ncbi:MAG: cyclic nucleotide-binding domain-containing protein, partial [Planctomycetia bacterium]|nr:cyclic nucleotide-binding domain-containing protein [Planctomycetia bacterium]